MSTASDYSDRADARRGDPEYQARKEARIARYRDRAARRAREAEARFKAADSIASHIPFGQPILVGHHSEGRHRRALKTIDTNMRKAFEASNEAKALVSRAESAESGGAISSRDPDAIRLLREKLEAEKVEHARRKAANAVVRKRYKADSAAGTYSKTIEYNVTMLESLPDDALPPDIREGLLSYGRVFPWLPQFDLARNTAEIKRVTDRITYLERMDATPAAEDVEVEGGITVSESVEFNTVEIRFPGKPPAEVISKLKTNGFRWVRTQGVWSKRRSAWHRQQALEIVGAPPES